MHLMFCRKEFSLFMAIILLPVSQTRGTHTQQKGVKVNYSLENEMY